MGHCTLKGSAVSPRGGSAQTWGWPRSGGHSEAVSHVVVSILQERNQPGVCVYMCAHGERCIFSGQLTWSGRLASLKSAG